MKKTFALQEPGKADPRVVEAVKFELRKYINRERRKKLPEGFAQWVFRCKAGIDRDSSTECVVPELTGRIDDVVRNGGTSVYIEILAEPSHREPTEPATPLPGA